MCTDFLAYSHDDSGDRESDVLHENTINTEFEINYRFRFKSIEIVNFKKEPRHTFLTVCSVGEQIE